MPNITFYQTDQTPGALSLLYVVIVARYEGHWVLVRHKDRNTYEGPGGHIEPFEDGVSAAKRELYEETGAYDFSLELVSMYAVEQNKIESGGYLFFAEIRSLSELPDYEIAERFLFDRLPENLTYPDILPALYHRVQGWLNLQSAKDELWDVYDQNRHLTGRTHRRGDPLANGDYHLVVHVWILNQQDEFLITKRTPNKGFPNLWECSGGSALKGDNSLEAALREVKEETGLDLQPSRGRILLSLQDEDTFCDIWLFRQDFCIEDVVFQPNETCGAKWANRQEIRQMTAEGLFIPFRYMDVFFEKAFDGK
jgi:nucleoside triphosphatase YtkD